MKRSVTRNRVLGLCLVAAGVIALAGCGTKPDQVAAKLAEAVNNQDLDGALVKVTLRGVPRGATIRLDRRLVRGTKLDVPVDGRSHLLVIWAHGFKRWSRNISPTENAEVRVFMAPTTAQGGKRSKRPRAKRPRVKRRRKAVIRRPDF